eukprot:11214946-Lingulodinium_polyedra.AAC.1
MKSTIDLAQQIGGERHAPDRVLLRARAKRGDRGDPADVRREGPAVCGGAQVGGIQGDGRCRSVRLLPS